MGPRYFDALGVTPDCADGPGTTTEGEPGHEVAVVNQELASRYFGNEDPIGKRIRLIDDTPAGQQSAWATIIGLRLELSVSASTPESTTRIRWFAIPHGQNATGASRRGDPRARPLAIRGR